MESDLRRWMRLVENMQRHDTDPALKAWLADSVVKHPVFHGTTAKLRASALEGKLIFFTDEPSVASGFAGSPDEDHAGFNDPGIEDGGTVYPCYIKLTNPYEGDEGWEEIENKVEWIRENGFDGFITSEHDGTTYCVFSPDQVQFAFG